MLPVGAHTPIKFMRVIRVRYGTDIPMALSNAERQKRHRERQKQKLAAAAPGLAAQYENVGADLREKLYRLIDTENQRRDRIRPTAEEALEPTDFSRVILDIALDEDHSGLASKARMILLGALCMGESSEKEIREARLEKDAALAQETTDDDGQDGEPQGRISPLEHYIRVPNFG
ncbi:hypothetical protein EV217_3070 [Phyllobacterium myrsinacearum]|nr:hypothetical protein EV217_3070 [Phyllobacterium myrsinacearum]